MLARPFSTHYEKESESSNDSTNERQQTVRQRHRRGR